MGKNKKNEKQLNIDNVIRKYEDKIRQLNEEHKKEIDKIITEYEECYRYYAD